MLKNRDVQAKIAPVFALLALSAALAACNSGDTLPPTDDGSINSPIPTDGTGNNTEAAAVSNLIANGSDFAANTWRSDGVRVTANVDGSLDRLQGGTWINQATTAKTGGKYTATVTLKGTGRAGVFLQKVGGDWAMYGWQTVQLSPNGTTAVLTVDKPNDGSPVQFGIGNLAATSNLVAGNARLVGPGSVTAQPQQPTTPPAPQPAPQPAPPTDSAPKPVPQPTSGKVLLQTSYTNSWDVPSIWYQQEAVSSGVTVASAPWDGNKHALKATINRGESWQGQGYPRSEVMTNDINVAYNKRYVYETGFYFPQGSYVANPSEMLALFQIHHDGGGTIPIAMYLKDGGLKLAVRRDTSSATWYNVLSSVPTGRLVNLRIEYYGATDNSGYIRVYIDGNQVVNHQGVTAYGGYGRVGYVKTGLYDYYNSVPGSLTVYLDDFKWTEVQ